jgi:hypothetical protein
MEVKDPRSVEVVCKVSLVSNIRTLCFEVKSANQTAPFGRRAKCCRGAASPSLAQTPRTPMDKGLFLP